METESQEPNPQHDALIASFCEIAASTQEEAAFFLESHNWDLDAAVSTFLDDSAAASAAAAAVSTADGDARLNAPGIAASRSPSPSQSQSPDYSPSKSPSRSRSPSPAPSRRSYELRSGGKKAVTKPSGSRPRGIRTLADLNRPADDCGSDSDGDSDEPQEYYTGGEKSGMLVQDPTRGNVNDGDAIFSQAAQFGALKGPSEEPRPSNSKSFTGKARLLSGETVSPASQPPQVVNHTITLWSNGFTVDDGPLRRFDDPENAPFLESIKKSVCPPELEPADRRTLVDVNIIRRQEDYPEPVKQKISFQGMGRTLGSSSSASSAAPETNAEATSLTTAPLPSRGLVVDESLPSTSLQLRLADGTRMVSRFNHHHTIRDIRSFIDASRSGGSRSYLLQVMGFPPKQLTDLDQTIEQAGIANSVVIQRL